MQLPSCVKSNLTQGWHAQSCLKNPLFIHQLCPLFILVYENICFRVAIGFQAAPPKGGRVGSTLLWTRFFFWAHHPPYKLVKAPFFLSAFYAETFGIAYVQPARFVRLLPRKRAAWNPPSIGEEKKDNNIKSEWSHAVLSFLRFEFVLTVWESWPLIWPIWFLWIKKYA